MSRNKHYFDSSSQQNKTKVLSYYSMLNHTSIKACFEHFDLLTVNDLNCMTHPVKGSHVLQKNVCLLLSEFPDARAVINERMKE